MITSELSNYEKINQLYYFVNNKFKDPNESYSELRLYDRSIEQTTALNIIIDCMDGINKDPEDVIFNKCLCYECYLKQLKSENVDNKNNTAIYFLTVSIKVFNVLIDYLKIC